MSTPSPPLCIQSVFAGQINRNSLSIPLKIRLENRTVETLSLLDSGAGGKFIDQNYAKTLNISLLNLEKPILLINVDRILNKKGIIKQYINLDLEIFGQKKTAWLLVTGLGKQRMLLGFPWPQKYNPIIDWQISSFYWQHISWKFNFKKIKTLLTKPSSSKPSISKEENPKEWMTQTVRHLGNWLLRCPTFPFNQNWRTNHGWRCLDKSRN